MREKEGKGKTSKKIYIKDKEGERGKEVNK